MYIFLELNLTITAIYVKNSVPIIIKDDEGEVIKEYSDTPNIDNKNFKLYYQIANPTTPNNGDMWLKPINSLNDL
jgi:hypothetical protein